MAGSSQIDVVQVRGGQRSIVTDHVVAEEPFELRLAGVPIAVLMRTPGHEEDLALGFCLTEAIVLGPHEVERIRPVPGDDEGERWEVELADGVTVDPEQFRRNTYTTSSCGVCGKASIDAVRIAAAPLPPGPQVSTETLLTLPGALRSRQKTFETTGGIHAAAVFTPDGDMLALREDVGRHNAVDKLFGAVARERWPLGELLLMVSGRVSFEIVQKAAVVGVPVVCGVSAASSLAVELGRELAMTVVGFLRGDGFNVYCGGERLA